MTATHAQRRMIPPVYFLLALIASVALHRYLPLMTVLSPPWSYLGLLPLALGLALAVVAVRLFAHHETPIRPFDESTTLVTAGVYRFTRNPMYLGMLAILTGIACLLGTAGAFLPLPVLAVILDRLFVRHEETLLEETFGALYAGYKAKVRRWL